MLPPAIHADGSLTPATLCRRLKQLQAQSATQEELLVAASESEKKMRSECKQAKLAALVHKIRASHLSDFASKLTEDLRVAEAKAVEANEKASKVRFQDDKEAVVPVEEVPTAPEAAAPVVHVPLEGAEARIAALEQELYAARRCIVLQTEMLSRLRAEKMVAEAKLSSGDDAATENPAQTHTEMLLGMPDTVTEEYHARWCEATAENVDLRAETASLKNQLDEALSIVETVAEIDSLQGEFDEICQELPQMQEAVCRALEEKVVAEQAE